MPSKHSAVRVQKQLDQRLATLNHRLSTYIVESELSQINLASVGHCIGISEDLWRVLEVADDVARLSEGAFDITIGPIVDLWGFGASDGDYRVPHSEEIVALMPMVGAKSGLQLDKEQRCLLKRKALKIDLSAVAKGYAVDELANILHALGATSFMIEVGGELRMAGNNARGKPWRIAIEKPETAARQVQEVLSLSGVGLATSGDYRNYFEVDGRRYSHTIDPRTGYPVKHDLASVTVVSANTAKADALATAILVLGPDEGMRLATQHGIAAFLVSRSAQGVFSTQHTAAFSPYLDTAQR